MKYLGSVLFASVVALSFVVVGWYFWQPNGAAIEGEVPVLAVEIPKAPDGFETYEDRDRKFYLYYPSELAATVTNNGSARTAVFQIPEGGYGFQIFVIPYTEPTISEEQFRRDIPTGVRTNEARWEVGGVEAVTFYSRSLVGETFEVWFIRDGYLYEVTTYRELEDVVRSLLETWRFL